MEKLRHILVNDDDPMMRSSLRTVLESKGYPVNTLPDGRRALALVEQSQPDAISGGGQILEAEFLDMTLQLGVTAVRARSADGDA